MESYWSRAGGQEEGSGTSKGSISVAFPLESVSFLPPTPIVLGVPLSPLLKVLGQYSGMADPKEGALPTKMENGSGVLADDTPANKEVSRMLVDLENFNFEGHGQYINGSCSILSSL